MAIVGSAKVLSSMKSGEDDIAKLIAERKKKNATPDPLKIAKEKEMESIYANKSRLDSMVASNAEKWKKNLTIMDSTSKITRRN